MATNRFDVTPEEAFVQERTGDVEHAPSARQRALAAAAERAALQEVADNVSAGIARLGERIAEAQAHSLEQDKRAELLEKRILKQNEEQEAIRAGIREYAQSNRELEAGIEKLGRSNEQLEAGIERLDREYEARRQEQARQFEMLAKNAEGLKEIRAGIALLKRRRQIEEFKKASLSFKMPNKHKPTRVKHSSHVKAQPLKKRRNVAPKSNSEPASGMTLLCFLRSMLDWFLEQLGVSSPQKDNSSTPQAKQAATGLFNRTESSTCSQKTDASLGADAETSSHRSHNNSNTF